MALKQANSVTVAVGQKVQDLIWVNSIFTHQVTPTSFLPTIELVVLGIHFIQVAIFTSNQPQSHSDQLWTEREFSLGMPEE